MIATYQNVITILDSKTFFAVGTRMEMSILFPTRRLQRAHLVTIAESEATSG